MLLASRNDLWQKYSTRATSAAPTYIKPHINQLIQQGYVDDALYHNNPVKIALHESRLIWPDLCDRTPDILLFLETGHHEKDTGGQAEISSPRRTQVADHGSVGSEVLEVYKPRDRLRILRHFHLVKHWTPCSIEWIIYWTLSRSGWSSASKFYKAHLRTTEDVISASI